MAEDWLQTSIASSTPDTITVAGRDLATDLMGRLSLTELAYLLVVGREPSAGERRLLDAVLVSLADHGLTPMALATRLTYTGAPESIQGAIASGLLGAGSVFLGPAGDTAQFLADALGEGGSGGEPAQARTDPTTRSRRPPDQKGGSIEDDRLREMAASAVAACREEGRRVPGLGHPVHRQVDPRTTRLYELATEESLLGPHMRLLRFVAEAHEEASGRRLPINGAGAGGAVLVDLGLPPAIVRGFVLIARTAGLVAHLAEEAEHPIGMPLWLEVEERASDDASPSD